jgi:hypothetical protein
MICDAPAQELQPPAWHLTTPGSSEPLVSLGFVTYGTQEQVTNLATAAKGLGLNCGLPKTDDGRIEIMVLFDAKTTRDLAFSFYNRVAKGEFGTTDTGLMIVPANAADKK